MPNITVNHIFDSPGALASMALLLATLVTGGCQDQGPATPPEALAGPDLQGVTGERVQLDGSGSNDPTGKALAFVWSFQSRPEGSSASLTSSRSPAPSFTPDVGGVYVVILTVNNGKLTDTDECRVTVNTPPVADAGEDRGPVPLEEPVALDGTGSHDPDGDAISFAWSFISHPPGSTASLSDPSSSSPDFTPDVSGTFVVELVVSDGRLSSQPDRVAVTANRPPVADAGSDQVVPVGEVVELDGGGSHDPEGAPVTYAWSLQSWPDGSSASLSDPLAVDPSFTADAAGDFVVRLTVSDGVMEDWAEVVVTAVEGNERPQAHAGSYPNAHRGDVVTLDGSGSSDPDGSPLSYAWSLESHPNGSEAVLSQTEGVSSSFSADMAGDYRVRLTVFDGQLSDSDETTITVDPFLTGTWGGSSPSSTYLYTLVLTEDPSSGAVSGTAAVGIHTPGWPYEPVYSGGSVSGQRSEFEVELTLTFSGEEPGTFSATISSGGQAMSGTLWGLGPLNGETVNFSLTEEGSG